MLKSNTAQIHGFADKMHFGNLAMLYYPDKAYKNALRLFRKEIQITRGLKEELEAAGYHGKERILTREQIRIIEDYLCPMD
jgi:hypothetical protein